MLEWEIHIEEKHLSSRLTKEEDTILFEFSTIEFGAEFAIWAYKALTNKYKFVLYNDNYSNILDMELVATSLDIVQEFI